LAGLTVTRGNLRDRDTDHGFRRVDERHHRRERQVPDARPST
jgi:hypothetical protein